jgi:hypothetical protein
MRQLCCHPQLSAADRQVLGEIPKSLEQIRQNMLAHSQGEHTKACKALQKAKSDLAQFKETATIKALARLANDREKLEQHGMAASGGGGDDDDSKVIFSKAEQARITALEEQIQASDKLVASTKQTQVYFEALVPKATEAMSEPCLICFDDIEEASITKCGHLFCTPWYDVHTLLVYRAIALTSGCVRAIRVVGIAFDRQYKCVAPVQCAALLLLSTN